MTARIRQAEHACVECNLRFFADPEEVGDPAPYCPRCGGRDTELA